MAAVIRNIRIEWYEGYKAEEWPRRLFLPKETVVVDQVLRQGQTPEGRFFELLGEDGRRYSIREVRGSWEWQLWGEP